MEPLGADDPAEIGGVLDADPDSAAPWLVTMYVPGLSLHQAVAVRGPMPVGTVLVLALKDGAYNNGGQLNILPAPYHYSCGRRTMREFFSNGSSENWRETVASRPTGS